MSRVCALRRGSREAPARSATSRRRYAADPAAAPAFLSQSSVISRRVRRCEASEAECANAEIQQFDQFLATPAEAGWKIARRAGVVVQAGDLRAGADVLGRGCELEPTCQLPLGHGAGGGRVNC